jgi:hypothetical protein
MLTTSTVIAQLLVYTMPGGQTVVGRMSGGEVVELQDASMFRDWVFAGNPGHDARGRYLGTMSRGWIPFAGLGHCR